MVWRIRAEKSLLETHPQCEDGRWFAPGELSKVDLVRAVDATTTEPVQLTPLSLWPDGSVAYAHVCFLSRKQEHHAIKVARVPPRVTSRTDSAILACQEALNGFRCRLSKEERVPAIQMVPLRATMFRGPFRWDFETWGRFVDSKLWWHAEVTYRPHSDELSAEVLFTVANMRRPSRKEGTIEVEAIVFEALEGFFLSKPTPRAFDGYPEASQRRLVTLEETPFCDGMAQVVHFLVRFRRPPSLETLPYSPGWHPEDMQEDYGCFGGRVPPRANQVPPADPSWLHEPLEAEDGRVYPRTISRFDGSVDAGAASYPNMKLHWDMPQLAGHGPESYWAMIEQANSFLERPGQRSLPSDSWEDFEQFRNWGGDELGTGLVNMNKGGTAPGRAALEAAPSNLRFRAGHSGLFSRCSVASQHTAPGHLFDAWIRTGKAIYRRGIVDMAECLFHEPPEPHSGRSAGSLVSIFHMARKADQRLVPSFDGASDESIDDSTEWGIVLEEMIVDRVLGTRGSYPSGGGLRRALPLPATPWVISLHQRGGREVIFEDWMTAWFIQTVLRLVGEELLVGRPYQLKLEYAQLYRVILETMVFICRDISDQELGHPYKAHIEPPLPHPPWVPCENETLIVPGKYHWKSSATWVLQALGDMLEKWSFRFPNDETRELFERHLERLIENVSDRSLPALASAVRYYELVLSDKDRARE